MQKNSVDLLEQLVKIPSYRETGEVAAFLKEILAAEGFDAGVIRRGTTANLVAGLGKGPNKLVLNAHTDTVPPQSGESVGLRREENTLFGLGTVDNKGGAVSMLAAFTDLASREAELNGRVLLCLVGDEENGGANGTAALVQAGYTAEVAVIGEPTHLNLCVGQKSLLHLVLQSNGIAQHSSRPTNDNAILKMSRVLSRLAERFPVPPSDPNSVFNATTLNMGTILGGSATNVVAAQCRATLDFRLPPSADPAQLRQVVEQATGTDAIASESLFAQGWVTPEQSPVAQLALSTLRNQKPDAHIITKFGSNDGRHYAQKGSTVVNFGPGDNKLSHSGREQIDAQSLEQARNAYREFALAILTSGYPSRPAEIPKVLLENSA